LSKKVLPDQVSTRFQSDLKVEVVDVAAGAEEVVEEEEEEVVAQSEPSVGEEVTDPVAVAVAVAVELPTNPV
jgi:hypothetical protein